MNKDIKRIDESIESIVSMANGLSKLKEDDFNDMLKEIESKITIIDNIKKNSGILNRRKMAKYITNKTIYELRKAKLDSKSFKILELILK